MLAKRIITCLDVRGGRVVKGVNFVNIRDAGDPVDCAKQYDAAGADEITFLDITASHESRGIMLDVVRRTADVVFAPLTVGGGVRSLEDVRVLLLAGADKVSVNSAAVERPELIREVKEAWGAQVLVLVVELRSGLAQRPAKDQCRDRARDHAAAGNHEVRHDEGLFIRHGSSVP